jgi:hypothetical protein
MNKEIAGGLGWAGAILALALGATIAQKLGYVDRDTVTRLVIGINGLMIAWYGNRIPKRFAPNACTRQAQRAAGWSQVLSGLTYAGLWAFAPMDVAIWAGMAVVAAGVLTTLGYCLSMQSKAKTG